MDRLLYAIRIVPNGDGVVRIIRKATGTVIDILSVLRERGVVVWEVGMGCAVAVENGADGLMVEGPVESYEPVWDTSSLRAYK